MTRWLEEKDRPLLEEALSKDEFHKTTTSDFFYAPGTACTVYEDESSPVFFLRATKALRIDIQFVDNGDKEKNIKTMMDGIGDLVEQARQAGFTELVFCSDSPGLKAFCRRRFKFTEVSGELRKFL